jgi:DNA-binding Lrp family transcriptional regulator
MNKGGRPKTFGRQNPAVLKRRLELVSYYRQAREQNEKHEAAIDQAVRRFRELQPGTKVSRTEVKRALAMLQPAGVSDVIVPQISHRELSALDAFRQKHEAAMATLERAGKEPSHFELPSKLVVIEMKLCPRPNSRVNRKSR